MLLVALLVFRAPRVLRRAGLRRGRRSARGQTAPLVVACSVAGVPGAVGPGRPRERHTRSSLGVVNLEACPDPPAPSTPAAFALPGCRLVRRLEARPGSAAALHTDGAGGLAA